MQVGAKAFLMAEYKWLAVFVLVVGGVVVTIGATLLAARVLRARQASEAARLAAGEGGTGAVRQKSRAGLYEVEVQGGELPTVSFPDELISGSSCVILLITSTALPPVNGSLSVSI